MNGGPNHKFQMEFNNYNNSNVNNNPIMNTRLRGYLIEKLKIDYVK